MGPAFLFLFAALGACKSDQLALRIASEDVAGDRRALVFAIRNQTSTACTLDGFATLRLLDRDDRPMAFEIRQNQGDPLFPREEVKRVRLNPKEEASFYFGFTGVDASGKPCRQSAKIEAAAPGGGTPMVLNAGVAPCGPIVNISPIHEGVLKSSTSPNRPTK